jgi:hypothetical protein
MVFSVWDPAVGEKGGFVLTPAKKTVRVAHTVVNDGHVIHVTRRLAFGQSGKGSDEPVLAIKLVAGKVLIKSKDGHTYPLLSPTGACKSEVSQQTKRFNVEEKRGSWAVHFGPSDGLHRVMSFEFCRGLE